MDSSAQAVQLGLLAQVDLGEVGDGGAYLHGSEKFTLDGAGFRHIVIERGEVSLIPVNQNPRLPIGLSKLPW